MKQTLKKIKVFIFGVGEETEYEPSCSEFVISMTHASVLRLAIA
jgi:hypothetical protein